MNIRTGPTVILFPVGALAGTPSAMAAIEENKIAYRSLVDRHVAGDWGDVELESAEANADALLNGTRLMSVYRLPSGVQIWIITEADRSSTTILLPEDY